MKVTISHDEKEILKTAAEELISWGENEVAKRIGAKYFDEAAGEFRLGKAEKPTPDSAIMSSAYFAAAGAGRRLWYRLMGSSDSVVIDEYDVPVISQAITYAISRERIESRAVRYSQAIKTADRGTAVTDRERKKLRQSYIDGFKALVLIGSHLAMKLQ